MRLPLAHEIAIARAAFDESREALPYLGRLEHALTATHIVMAGAADSNRPGAEILAAVLTRWPALAGPNLTLEHHEALLQRARAHLAAVSDDLTTRNMVLASLQHDQAHLAMDPVFDDMLVELAELDALHTAAEAALLMPAHRLNWCELSAQALQVILDLAKAQSRPAEDPLGAAGYRAGALANSYGLAAQAGVRSFDFGVALPTPPPAPETVDPADSDLHWASLAAVISAIQAVVDVLDAEKQALQPLANGLVAEQQALQRKIYERSG